MSVLLNMPHTLPFGSEGCAEFVVHPPHQYYFSLPKVNIAPAALLENHFFFFYTVQPESKQPTLPELNCGFVVHDYELVV